MNIIIIDDEQFALDELATCVHETIPEATIKTFTSSREALAYASTVRVDVAFSDIRMPEISGIGLAKALKKQNPFINIIFVTSYSEYKDESIFLHVSGYICKPATTKDIMIQMDNLLFSQTEEYYADDEGRIHAQTFGNFEFFVDGKPLTFTRSKAKEMLAYLIDRQGAAVSKKELCGILYEDDYSVSKQNYFTQVVSALRSTLQENGCENVLIRKYNSYSVDTSTFSCDSYSFLAGDTQAINRFRGEYMEQYGWAEMFKSKFYE